MEIAYINASIAQSLTSLCTSHQISLGQDDWYGVLLHWSRLLIFTQHDVVLDDVSEINVRKLATTTHAHAL